MGSSPIELPARRGAVADGRVQRVRLVVESSRPACTSDLSEATVQWVSDDGVETVVVRAAPADAPAVVEARTDPNGSFPTLDEAADRFVITLHCSQLTGPLSPGTSVSLTLTLQSGDQAPRVRIQVPDSLPESGTVDL